MKRVLVFFFLVTVSIVIMVNKSYAQYETPTFIAGKVYVAYGFGGPHGYHNVSDDELVNPGVGGGMLFGFNAADNFLIEFDITFLYWYSETNAEDLMVLILPFYTGVKYYINNFFGITAGFGGQWFLDSGRNSEDDSYDDMDNKSKTYFSAYVGAEFKIASVLIRPKFIYVYHSEDPTYSIWLEFAYLFETHFGY